jgi:hypothetical protein
VVVDGGRIGSRRAPGEPDSMPHMIMIGWPLQPSVVDPRRFPEVAAAIARLTAEAYTALAQIEARGQAVNAAEAMTILTYVSAHYAQIGAQRRC